MRALFSVFGERSNSCNSALPAIPRFPQSRTLRAFRDFCIHSVNSLQSAHSAHSVNFCMPHIACIPYILQPARSAHSAHSVISCNPRTRGFLHSAHSVDSCNSCIPCIPFGTHAPEGGAGRGDPHATPRRVATSLLTMEEGIPGGDVDTIQSFLCRRTPARVLV